MIAYEPEPYPHAHDPKPVSASARSRLPWTWLEWFAVSQTLVPALLFVPGLEGLRTLTRVAVFGIALAAGALVYSGQRRRGVGRQAFAPLPWLAVGLAWMAVSIGHPDTNSLSAGFAAVVLTAAVCAPAFWAGELMDSPRRFVRLMTIVFLCQALNAAVGLLQVGWPEIFLPPSLKDPVKQRELLEIGHAYASGGRIIVRPSGLTDQAGAASAAGAAAGLLGLAWAIAPAAQASAAVRGRSPRDVRSWMRWAGLALAGIGMATVFFTMVRAALAIWIISLAAFTALLWKQGLKRQLSWLAAAAAAGGLALVFLIASTNLGERILGRFATLFDNDPTNTYVSNRGHFVAHAFSTMIWESPLGGGLGRWGMIHQHFGDHQTVGRGESYWIEVQWSAWILDGGFVLLIAYAGAMLLAMRDTARVALHPQLDPNLNYWAAVAFALNLSVVALTFSYVPFQSPLGMQFWLLAAAAHGASRSRE